jgi:hypothetical protein
MLFLPFRAYARARTGEIRWRSACPRHCRDQAGNRCSVLGCAVAYDTRVISPDDALRLARPWAINSLPSCNGEVGLYEFELGYVAWPAGPRPPADEWPPQPPLMLGGPNLVIDKQTGELSVWPSVAPETVADMYRHERRARHRFPADVRAVLDEAGWRPGRDVSAWVNRWLREVYDEYAGAREGLTLFPVAQAALAEFGGLRFAQRPRPGDPGSGFRVELWPDVGRVVVDLYTSYAADLGVPVFPFAWYEDGPSDAVVDVHGRVFLLHPIGDFLVADTVDGAITALIRGPELRQVDHHGSVLTN